MLTCTPGAGRRLSLVLIVFATLGIFALNKAQADTAAPLVANLFERMTWTPSDIILAALVGGMILEGIIDAIRRKS